MAATPPVFGLTAFSCPHCDAYAKQTWFEVKAVRAGILPIVIDGVNVALCDHCATWSIWMSAGMVFPVGKRSGEPPLDGMPANVRALYEEARDVASRSPRSGAALLRLALQTLIDDLEPGVADLNRKIGSLVAKGLSPEISNAMDIVRVIGNNSVHPGQIDIQEDATLVPALFSLLNLIVEQVVVRRAAIDALFEGLPEGARNAISRRDSVSPEGSI